MARPHIMNLEEEERRVQVTLSRRSLLSPFA